MALGFVFGVPALRLTAARFLDGAAGPGGFANDPTAWFEVSPDNRVRLFVPKVEMGQGIHTAIAQIGAEELAIPWEQLDVQQASTHVGPADSFGTGASNSVTSSYGPLREAAAILRTLLVGEAAVALSLPVTSLEAVDGGVQVVGDPTQRLTYGDLVARQPAWEVPEEAPALKAVADFTVIGQSKPRVDIPAKVTGQAVYGFDMRMDGMLYGAVARPPTLEAKLVSAAEGTAMQVDGVVQVVIKDDFAGVVATSRAAARVGVNQMDIVWDEGKLWQQAEIEDLVAIGDGGGVTVQKEGDAPRLLADGASLSAEYFTPLAAHASLETQAASGQCGGRQGHGLGLHPGPKLHRRECGRGPRLQKRAGRSHPHLFGRRLWAQKRLPGRTGGGDSLPGRRRARACGLGPHGGDAQRLLPPARAQQALCQAGRKRQDHGHRASPGQRRRALRLLPRHRRHACWARTLGRGGAGPSTMAAFPTGAPWPGDPSCPSPPRPGGGWG